MPAKDQYFDVDDCHLRFRDEGGHDEAREAVVLVHGWPLDLDTWDLQAADLARTFRVIRFDRRGFGLSSGRPSLATDADDLLTLLDQLHVARAAIVGMSQGARIALQAALIAPHRISSLVLDGPPAMADADLESDNELPLAHYRELVRTRGLGAFRRDYLTHPFAQLNTTDRHAHRLLEQVVSRYPGRDLRDARETSTIPDPRSLQALRKPTLVMTGELDTDARKRAGDALRAALPRAERAWVPAAGHMANLDNPRTYNDIVQSFLKRQFLAAA